MSDERFIGLKMINGDIVIVDMPRDEYNDLPNSEKEDHVLLRIKTGVIAPDLARAWVKQIVQQLNEADARNLAMAKLA